MDVTQPNPIRSGNRWLFADGTTLPVVSGGDGPVEPVDVPEDLTALSDEDLQALVDAQVAEFDALHDAESDDMDAMTEIAAGIKACRAEQSKRENAAAAVAAQRAELAAEIHADDTPEEPEGDPDDPDAPPADPDAPAPPVDAPAPDAPAPEPVTAGATRRPNPGDAARRRPRPNIPAAPTPNPIVITAAAESGLPVGNVDLGQVAVAMHEKARVLPDMKGMGQGHGGSKICTLTVPQDPELILTDNPVTNQAILKRALGGNLDNALALVAAGGWCIPSQPVFNLFSIGDSDGLIDVPSVGVRAGMLIPSFFGFGDVSGALWNWNENQDQLVNTVVSNKVLTSNVATLTTTVPHRLSVGRTVVVTGVGFPFDGTWVVTAVPSSTTFSYADVAANVGTAASTGAVTASKGCMRIPCPTWTDYRLEAEGLCVSHGNLTDRAFPELTRTFLDTVMMAHEHRMSAAKIAKINTDAAVVAPPTATGDAPADVLEAIVVRAASMRSHFRAARTRVVETLLPDWTIDMFRSVIAKRSGMGKDVMAISDAEVQTWFNLRNIRPQFLSDYQPLYVSAEATTFPATLEFTSYFAGAYVVGEGGQIDLGVVRDSVMNSTNDFTAGWSEEFFQVARVGPQALKTTVTLDLTGVTGGP